MTQVEKIAFLRSYGYTVGDRNPQLNTNYPGAFMVVEPYEDWELPTEDGANGPWCITGDNLDALVDQGYEFLTDHIDPELVLIQAVDLIG